ncbi:unannotated protein [freshwater metagenome]|uniref:Unannotated protein n=1 Tax=freshwater metagenome TaxID=449393 RepID=A0A6J7FR92_9ZZZZ|nr:cupin domain-containing protein [Actinomycetota bacterium]
MRMKPLSPARRAVGGMALIAVLVAAGCSSTAASDAPPASSVAPSTGVVRTMLAHAVPANAPGQELYLQEVTIAAGAKLSRHLHEGTQVASVRSGTLTYNIVSGTAVVTRADGTVQSAEGPTVIELGPGDAITETATLVHFGANNGKVPVVILLAALLTEGAPVATPHS